MKLRNRTRTGMLGIVPRSVLKLAYAGVVPACATGACGSESDGRSPHVIVLAIAGFAGRGVGGSDVVVLAISGFGGRGVGGSDVIVLAVAGFGGAGGGAGGAGGDPQRFDAGCPAVEFDGGNADAGTDSCGNNDMPDGGDELAPDAGADGG